MKLFTKDIDKKLFAQYPKGNNLEQQQVVAKIFNPYGRGTWYIINSDPSDPDYLWAIVDLFEVEVGSVSRNELESIKVPPFGLHLERDMSFTPTNAASLLEGLEQGKMYEKGGETGYSNKAMLENIAETIEHHIKEFEAALKKTDGEVMAWVLTKAQRASTDLADITHYLESQNEIKREEVEGEEDEYANGGEVKWAEADYGDSALVVSENKMGIIIKPYGRKFHLKFVDGTEKTYDASELKFFKDIDEFDLGGDTPSPNTEFMKWFVDWFKSVNKYVYISMSIPNEFSSPIKDGKGKIVLLDVIEKKGDNDAKKYFNEILKKADEFGVSIYLQPIPRTNNLKSEDHKKKITKDYLIKYYEKFGFENTNGGFMVREPKMAEGGQISSYSVIYYETIPIRGGEKFTRQATRDSAGGSLDKVIENAQEKLKSRGWSYADIMDLKKQGLAAKIKDDGSVKMYAGGGKVKFKDKVEAIKASLLKRKKVPAKVQKDYGKTFSPSEAEDSAKRIVGAMTAKERLQMRLKSKKRK